ncbi:hypothetical protein BCEP4_800050 [Burkholderia cepacia]|nr:hypothetical protein BCEP4_800050 [Burkholderia cepacia]
MGWVVRLNRPVSTSASTTAVVACIVPRYGESSGRQQRRSMASRPLMGPTTIFCCCRASPLEVGQLLRLLYDRSDRQHRICRAATAERVCERVNVGGLQSDALRLVGGLAAAVMNPSPSPKPRRRHRQPPKNLASEPVGWTIWCAIGFSPALPLRRVQ